MGREGVEASKHPASGDQGKFGMYSMEKVEGHFSKEGWPLYKYWMNGDWPIYTIGAEKRLVRSSDSILPPYEFHVWILEQRVVQLQACMDGSDDLMVTCYSMGGEVLTKLKIGTKD